MSAKDARRLLRRPNVPKITLRRILYFAPEPYRARAWRRILATEEPTEWCGILRFATRTYRTRAAERMIRVGVKHTAVLLYAPPASRQRAARVLLAGNPTGLEFQYIVRYVADPWRRRAWDRLRAHPDCARSAVDTARHLLTAKRMPRAYRTEAAELLIAHGKRNVLEEVVQHASKPQRMVAARMLIARRQGLVHVLLHVEEATIREEAWAAFVSRARHPRGRYELEGLLRDVERLRERLPGEWRCRLDDVGQHLVALALERARDERTPHVVRESCLCPVVAGRVGTEEQRRVAARQLSRRGLSQFTDREVLIALERSALEPFASVARTCRAGGGDPWQRVFPTDLPSHG